MIKLRNITPDSLSVGRPEPEGMLVEKDGVIEVDGELVEETDEAYVLALPTQAVIGFEEPDDAGNARPRTEPERRAYPKTVWRLVGSPRRAEKGSDA